LWLDSSIRKASLAGGSLAAGLFLLLAQKKEAKEKGTPFAGLRLPADDTLKPGNAETRFAFNFKGGEARTSALLLTGLSLPPAAAQRGRKSRPQAHEFV
jgi:hypothetical protein